MPAEQLVNRYAQIHIQAACSRGYDLQTIFDRSGVTPKNPSNALFSLGELIKLSRNVKLLLKDEFCGFTKSGCKPGAFEMMVDFWGNHFNIYIGKFLCKVLKTDDDLRVIRPNAPGKFTDLLYASAKSPAMLVYLDQAESLGESPNENYARELMELHTVGVGPNVRRRKVCCRKASPSRIGIAEGTTACVSSVNG